MIMAIQIHIRHVGGGEERNAHRALARFHRHADFILIAQAGDRHVLADAEHLHARAVDQHLGLLVLAISAI